MKTTLAGILQWEELIGPQERQALLQDVWGYSYTEGTRTVDVHVRRLREKMPAFAGSIVTVKSLGYRIPRDAE